MFEACRPALAAAAILLSGAALAQTRPEPPRGERGEPMAAMASQPPGLATATPGEGARIDSGCESGAGQGEARALDPRADRARCRKLSDADIATAPISEVRRVSRHTVTISGRTIPYTATAGTLTVRDDEGKPTLSMFYVAYTAEGPNRPVTFLYNGGPGSSSMWLHMGSVGPVRVVTDSPAPTHNAPFAIVENGESLLDRSDLVFLDAPGAGFSRPLGETRLSAFWGVDPDIDTFARAIERWLTINDRWNAPKFLFGESYGTTRSAGLAHRLQQDGAQLNGVILLSSILNYGRRDPGFDRELINYIPSYAAIAAYHHRLAKPPADLGAFLGEARAFAAGPYAEALAAGQDLPDADRRAVAERLAGFIGLSPEEILRADLRIEPARFRKSLLRDQRLTLGRYDARFTGFDVDAEGDSPEYDPSDTAITGAFVSAFHHYLATDLGYVTELSYRPTYYSSGVQWDLHHRGPANGPEAQGSSADTALDLSAAMRRNPHLRLLSLNGVYDLATPFFGTEYDVAHMQLDPPIRGNVSFRYYPSGHMVYLNTEALRTMKADLARFYDEAAPH